ncbi:cation diffusion facilitator family transporter [Brevibacterium sp. 91QC2O2]|uniref:cation diffusion facilitator family transporter n=1 Tax=Brevibacterium sp. 91QC2O2 TaxID=2968458 RepID=UPI00211C0802|nr:cation diffusion facilitator family transporter [Brevibacterium sp. 91QC2O2]MCQ9369054.1 cation diffusion facilitator family transporter [Brevibacterium sp. 91QC2O2]
MHEHDPHAENDGAGTGAPGHHGHGGLGHDHGGAHGPGGAASHVRLLIAFSITALVFLAELVTGLVSGSLALLTDAGHMAADAIGLGMAVFAANIVRRPRTDTHTWGWARVEVLVAGAQATLLMMVGLYGVYEGISRLFHPAEVHSQGVLVVGIVGLLANIVSALVLFGARDGSLNLRAAFLEVMADGLGSVAVIISAIIVWSTGWEYADSLAGLLIAIVIVPRAWALLRRVYGILVEEAPPELDLREIIEHIEGIDQVMAVHDVHLTRVGSSLPVLSAHVTLRNHCFHDGSTLEILTRIQDCLKEHFPLAIEHTTIQFDSVRGAQEETLKHGQ